MHTVGIFSGRFQPPHKGHQKLFNIFTGLFADTHVATSNVISVNNPFSLNQKQKLFGYLGIYNVKKVKNPYKPVEILKDYDNEKTVVVYGISSKDYNRFKITDTSYFQWYDTTKPKKSFKHNGYVCILPTYVDRIMVSDYSSASEIRSAYLNANSNERRQIINNLYGKYEAEIESIFESLKF
jgi:hypothetical protein